MRYFSVFSGVGGFELGIERAYADLSVATREEQGRSAQDRSDTDQQRMATQPLCVGLSEVDKYASAVLKHHYPHIHNYGDITKIDWSTVPDFDLLVGGSPCQDLSVAGKRIGLNGGTRSVLFWEFVRCLENKKPDHFIWENVKGALSSNGGRDFAEVLNAFSEAGYSLWWQVLNAKDFGVPQNRERIFVVGARNGSPREILFERGEGEGDGLPVTIVAHRKGYRRNLQTFSPEGLTEALDTAQGGGRGHHVIAKTIRVGGGGSPHGSKQNWDSYEVEGRIRRLTPRECERLMSWPDDWTKIGVFCSAECKCTSPSGKRDGRHFDSCYKEISDSQRYKMCGNGVVSAVVSEVVKAHIL